MRERASDIEKALLMQAEPWIGRLHLDNEMDRLGGAIANLDLTQNDYMGDI